MKVRLKEDFPFLCQHCQSFNCLFAPWVPQDELKEWISIWKEEARRIKGLEKEPSLFEKVRHLQFIRPEELLEFFQKNCQPVI